MVTELLQIYFYNNQWFLDGAGTTSRWTISGWVFVKCNYVVQVCLLSISKRKMNVTFTRELFALKNSGWALLLERSYFIPNNQPGPRENFKIICYNDSSWVNLKDGGSQGGFITDLVGENKISSTKMWKL